MTVRILPDVPDMALEFHEPAGFVTGFSKQSLEVTVYIDKNILDRSWHAVWVDLAESVKEAVDRYEGIQDKEDWYMAKATRIVLMGQIFRLDNLMFRSPGGDHEILDHPDMFELGPLYAQIFEPYRYLFIVDYKGMKIIAHDINGNVSECKQITDLMLNPDNFITDPDEIKAYWVGRGADPGLFGEEADPVISAIFDRDFTVDPTLPIFADEALRVDANGRVGVMAQSLIDQGTLGWNFTVYWANDIQSFLLQPLAIFPYDGMPTYLPARFSAMDVIKAYGKPYYFPELVFMLESALWNAGVQVWPNIAALNYTPQHFEDLIVTLEVTNGVHSDIRTFPISVVNYPVENHPPVLQLDIEDPVFHVGEVGEYLVNFIDPDCFIFSMSPEPKTTHTPAIAGTFRTDMDDLYWKMTINHLEDMSSYPNAYWPTQGVETTINGDNGLISFISHRAIAVDAIIECEERHKDESAFGEVTILCTYPSDKNRPPVITARPEEPIVKRAGQEIILSSPQISVKDPDREMIFASSNIGFILRCDEDEFIWRFLPSFPGQYEVRIEFYDIRGGYATLEFQVDVKPWWSYN